MPYTASILLALSVAGPAAAAAIGRPTIDWQDCSTNITGPLECGSIAVPLDYSEPRSNTTLDLKLVKIPATKQPCQGSILFNPGGPGLPGISPFKSGTFGRALASMTGGRHNLISFDPRGTGETMPFECFQTPAELLAFGNAMPTSLNASDAAIGQAWAIASVHAQACLEANPEQGKLLGTAFVARDMLEIVDALREDGLLRFWGQSYGSVLGATVAAMFPERMDKLVLDGVVNVEEYYSNVGTQDVQDADETLEAFYSACFDTPSLCPVANLTSGPDELRTTVATLLSESQKSPIVLGPNITTDVVTYSTLKTALFFSVRDTSFWPVLASALTSFLTSDPTAWRTITASLQNINLDSALTSSLPGIRCSDSVRREDNLADILPQLDDFFEASKLTGDQQPASVLVPCVQWKLDAKERFLGPYTDIKLATPPLFLANTRDPSTSLASAKYTSAGFDGSVVLEQIANGHTSVSQPSACTVRAIKAYFNDGVLPASDTVCDSVPAFRSPDFDLFEFALGLEE